MRRRMTIVIAVFMLLSVTAIGQNWTYQGAWPDTNYKGGTHGIVVDPDGKVWTASYYHTNWVSPSGDTITNSSPIYIFNSDGTLNDIIGIVTSGTFTDTLGIGGSSAGCRGMTRDESGNIIYDNSGVEKLLIKIDYKTKQGLARHVMTEVGSSPTKPGVSDDGTVFVAPVVSGAATAIAMYDKDLNYVGNAVTGEPSGIARTMEVSKDGNTIYYASFTGPQMMFVYQRPDQFSDYVLKDTVLQGMSDETLAWNPSTGNLWVSNDARGTGPYTELTWYEMDPATYDLVDSLTMPLPDPSGTADMYPRGAAFSNDGNVLYVGLFGIKYNRLYKFDRVTGVMQEFGAVVKDYNLSQNYPNPFNPTTTISFDVVKTGHVTLKVYDMIGREVATLVNQEMQNGSYRINFNASNLASGNYIYQLNVNGKTISKKMTLLK